MSGGAAVARLLVVLAALGRAQTPDASPWEVLTPARVHSSGGATLTVLADGSVLASGAIPDRDTWTVEAVVARKGVTGFRIEALTDPSLPGGGPGYSPSNGNFVLSEFTVEMAARNSDSWKPVALGNASADFEQIQFPAVAAIDGSAGTGWAIAPQQGVLHEATFESPRDLGFDAGERFRFSLAFNFGGRHSIGKLRLAFSTSPRPLRARRDDGEILEAQGKVPAAIDRGVRWLLEQQELDGSFAWHQPESHHGMTSLAGYTLLKCGLPKSHPAVLRAIDFIRTKLPERTYEAGLELMALGELEDPADEKRTQETVDRLLAWQAGGGWAYPSGTPDLSNTQYAALGLRAAAHRGAKIPPEAWTKLADHVVAHQEPGTAAYDGAGFGYHGRGAAYGSVTAGAVGVLRICNEQLDKAVVARGGWNTAEKRGLQWLDRNFAANTNPKGDQNWVYYWLYGIERVGGLCGITELGGRDWYREGAKFIVEQQKAEGHWDADNRPQPTTCFALLFLARATSTISGAAAQGVKVYGADDAGADASLRASGDTPLTVWVSSVGDATKAALTWPEDGDRGLRVRAVDYVLPGRALLPDARQEGGRWRATTEPPPSGWEQPDFDDSKWKPGAGAFGLKGTPGTAVRTEWKSDALWLRREFLLDDGARVAPELELLFSSALPVGGELSRPSPLCLFDEEEGFPALLHERSEGSTATLDTQEPFNGKRCLAVTPVQVHAPVIKGWHFPITEKPGPAEYRYLRFAWRKEGGSGVMIQLAQNGAWDGRTRRFVAGPNELGWAAVTVDKETPKRWSVVTVDLWKEFGGNGMLTGLALTPMRKGVGYYDSFWLARSLEDFRNIPKSGIPERGSTIALPPSPTLGASAPAGPVAPPDPMFEVFLNGVRLYADAAPKATYSAVGTELPVNEILKPGRNLLAVHARRAGPGQAVDVGIVDPERLATVAGREGGPAEVERWPAQIHFPRNGSYELRARLHVLAPPPAQGELLVESAPLAVTIREALDEELLGYARDPARNLLASAAASATASSFLDGNWLPQRAIDGFQGHGWLSADGDVRPALSVTLGRPVRADTILVSPLGKRGLDAERTFRIRRIEVDIDGGRGGTFEITLPEELRKGVLRLPRPTIVRRLDFRIADVTDQHASKNALGLAEVELQLQLRK